mgnify:CR=1 FL=1
MSLQGTQDDDLLLYQIAKMYYVEGLSQDAIASKVSFSRSYVSRLLDRAKERRIVTFNVMNPMAETVDGLERHLAELFDLKFVSIEGVSAAEHHGKTGRTLNDSIARHAAAMLPGFLSTASTVTVGFGETLYRMSKELRAQKPQEALSFVPAVGTVSTASPQTQSNIIVDNLATAFGGRSFFTNVPVVADRAESKSRLYQSHRSELLHQWELADAAIVGLGAPYRSSADPFSLNEATDEYRALVGMHITYQTGVREMFRMMKEGWIIGLLADQDTNRHDGIVLDFFGQQTNCVPGPAAMARSAGIGVIPGCITRKKDGTHKIILHAPVEVPNTKDKRNDVRTAEQAVNRILEQHIREHPEEWFWLHDRWKSMREEF